MPKLTEREFHILVDYRDVIENKTNDVEGWAYPSELGYTSHSFKKLVLWGYLELDGLHHSADSDYRITSRGLNFLKLDGIVK